MTNPAQPIARLAFRNLDMPGLGLEVFDFAELRRRATVATLCQVHRPSFHQLMLVTGGSGTAMVDFVEYPCRAGVLLHVAPGQVQTLPYSSRGVPAELDALMAIFEPDFPRQVQTLAARPGHLSHAVSREIPTAEQQRLIRCWEDLDAEYLRARRTSEVTELDRTLLQQLLDVLLLRLARLPITDRTAGHAANHPAASETYARFVEEVERSFANTRSVAAYATRLGYATRTLTRACQAATGHPPKTLIDNRVTLEAKRLLAHSRLPIAAIGHQLGFSESSNFGKFFARQTGQTPGEFRARQQPIASAPVSHVTGKHGIDRPGQAAPRASCQ